MDDIIYKTNKHASIKIVFENCVLLSYVVL